MVSQVVSEVCKKKITPPPRGLQHGTEEMVLANRGVKTTEKQTQLTLSPHQQWEKCNYKNVLFLLKREKRSESVGIIPAELIFK